MRKKNILKIIFVLIISFILGIFFCMYLYKNLNINNVINKAINTLVRGRNNNIEIDNTVGSENEIIFGDLTGTISEYPKDAREILDYRIKYGTGGIDYIVASPLNQPDLNSSDGAINTDKMHKYLYQNRIKFNIVDTSREGFIMFITTYPINKNSNLFFGLDGSTIGWIDISQSLYTENRNEFLYKLNELNLIGNNNYHFSKDLSGKTTISINAVVGEVGNKVEKIIIFFR